MEVCVCVCEALFGDSYNNILVINLYTNQNSPYMEFNLSPAYGHTHVHTKNSDDASRNAFSSS